MSDKFQTFDRFPSYSRRNYRYVDWDEFVIGEGEDLIGTDGVSPCLAITLYNTQKRRGVLAHIASLHISPEELKPARVIDTLLHQLNGSEKLDYQKLEATLSGEGTILVESERNSPIVRAKIKDYGIPIIGEDLCRAPGRLVFLHCDTGRVEVYRT